MEEWYPAFTHHVTSATSMEINPVGFVVDRVMLSENKI
jgi:type IV secretory pathway component VirB8